MKKLFAGLVAILALAPVVANAASYTAGQYVNFAGTAEDAQHFRSENYDECEKEKNKNKYNIILIKGDTFDNVLNKLKSLPYYDK